jgi:ATP-dependent RNA helicase DeaD
VNEDFESLGLAAELAAAATSAGFDEPTPVQAQSVPVLRRGGNVVLHAGSGSGVTAAYVLGLLDRVRGQAVENPEPDGDALRPRVLVVTPTEDRAVHVARTFTQLGSGDLSVRALTLAWAAGGTPSIVIGAAGTVGRSVRESALKLDAVEAIVFDRLATTLKLEDPALVETIAASVPAAAQRVVTFTGPARTVERFIEAHARRALTVPPRSLEPEPPAPAEPAGTLAYVIATREQKPAALARVLRRPRPEPPVVTTRTRRGVTELREELALRGFASEGPDAGMRIRAATDVGPAARIAYDVPVDASQLGALDLKDGLVLVEPDQLPHLRALAADASVVLKAVGAGRALRGSIAAFREAVRRAMLEEDLDAQVTLLEPLFEEHEAIEIAAALSALLRTRRVESEPEPTQPQAAGEKPLAFVRLFVSAGNRDNIRPGDLVGAITGEASVTGEEVGRIEIRDTFSVVEVASGVADKVIKALNGTTLRGRSLRVDYDRRGAPAPRPPRLGRPAR